MYFAYFASICWVESRVKYTFIAVLIKFSDLMIWMTIRAPSEWPFFAYSNIPYSFIFIFEYGIYSNMRNSLQNEPYWSKIHWELTKLQQNMPIQSQYAFMISILLSRIGARTGNIKTKLLIRHHMRDEGMATYPFRFLTSYSNIRILLGSKKYSNFEFYSYSLGALSSSDCASDWLTAAPPFTTLRGNPHFSFPLDITSATPGVRAIFLSGPRLFAGAFFTFYLVPHRGFRSFSNNFPRSS